MADVVQGWLAALQHLGRHRLLQLLRGDAHARHPLICSVADAVAVALEFEEERSRRVAPRTGWAASSALPLELAYILHLGFVAGRDRRVLRGRLQSCCVSAERQLVTAEPGWQAVSHCHGGGAAQDDCGGRRAGWLAGAGQRRLDGVRWWMKSPQEAAA
jgi:hypothetical protein